jgi:hypothetical protein
MRETLGGKAVWVELHADLIHRTGSGLTAAVPAQAPGDCQQIVGEWGKFFPYLRSAGCM